MVRRGSTVLAVAVVLVAGLVPGGAGVGLASAAPVTTPSASDDLPGGTYVPVTPARVLDTRSGLGAPRGTGRSVALQVTGRGGVPIKGVAAVVLNVTVPAAGAAGWLAVSPTGTTSTSNVNFAAGRDVAQLATSRVDPTGRVVLTSSTPVHAVADVVGWFTDSAHAGAGATYRPATSRRLFDSRRPGAGGVLVGGVARRIPLTDVPAGTTAVAVNLTTVRPNGTVYVTAWASGPRPTTSSMNVAAGDVRSNRAIVPLAADRSITVAVNAGHADLVVDLSGWFTAGVGAAGGARFVPLEPTRLLDTRHATGLIYPSLEYPLRGHTFPVAGQLGLPPADALVRPVAAWLSVTVVSSGWAGWLALAPSRKAFEEYQPPPGTSDVNVGEGVTPNAVLGALGDDGAIRNSSALAPTGARVPDTDPQLVVDLAGVFVQVPRPAVGLWRGGRPPFSSVPSVDQGWNREVPGAPSDIVEVAGMIGGTAVLRRDGTVLQLRDGTAPTVLLDGAAHLTSGSTGLYVVRTDGTVWTDDRQSGMHGVPGTVTTFGPVAGLDRVRSVAAGVGGAQAVRTDGTVVAWGGSIAPRAQEVTGLPGPVRAVAMFAGGGRRQCTAYEDGSVDVRLRDTPWSTVAGVGAVSMVPSSGDGCYAVDGSGRVHRIAVTDGAAVDHVLPGVTAAAITEAHVCFHVLGATGRCAEVRVLAADGTVWDRVLESPGFDQETGRWVHVEELDGAAAIGGAGSQITWIPPTH